MRPGSAHSVLGDVSEKGGGEGSETEDLAVMVALGEDWLVARLEVEGFNKDEGEDWDDIVDGDHGGGGDGGGKEGVANTLVIAEEAAGVGLPKEVENKHWDTNSQDTGNVKEEVFQDLGILRHHFAFC